MKHTSIENIVLSILKEKDLLLTIGEITHKVRQRTGTYRELRADVRTAVESLCTDNKLTRFFMGHHRSKLTGAAITPKWGYRVTKEHWGYDA
ncbi:hypothetical protein C6503_19500 [Candidatus Poribacteria bacterium]|nr:MAG: hypothetical protein C6503_19500 [Candidatus Poribacteria bacterium]